jgi:hypothetical protein
MRSLLEQNLDSEPWNTRDLWLWFQAFRRTPSFDWAHAVDRLQRWVSTQDTVEAHYYLYVLFFLRWYQGVLGDHRLMMQEVQETQARAPRIGRGWSYEWLGKGPEWCPLVSRNELGDYDQLKGFYERPDNLVRVQGQIREIKSPQAGEVSIIPIDAPKGNSGGKQHSVPAFFVPRQDFLRGRDELRLVDFYLGFSYEGLRAWDVLPSEG